MSTTNNRAAALDTLKTLRILVRELPQDQRTPAMVGVAQVERLLKLLGSRTEDEYDKLHGRCCRQRRELRRLNRKIHHQQLYVEARLRSIVAGENPVTAMELYHRVRELESKLSVSDAKILELLVRRVDTEAAE